MALSLASRFLFAVSNPAGGRRRTSSSDPRHNQAQGIEPAKRLLK